MAENIAQIDSAQIDWISLDDKRAALRRARSLGAERVGIVNLAHWLDQDPSTVRNQLAYRDRKTPSAEIDDLVWLLDREFRQQKAGQAGELLIRPPDLTAEEALRLLLVRAQSSWDKRALAEVTDIVGRVKP